MFSSAYLDWVNSQEAAKGFGRVSAKSISILFEVRANSTPPVPGQGRPQTGARSKSGSGKRSRRRKLSLLVDQSYDSQRRICPSAIA